MSQLAYMTKKGAGVVECGTAYELGPKLKTLKVDATLRSDHGAVIGESRKCDGVCDGDCGGWHWHYDPTGDGVAPESEESC